MKALEEVLKHSKKRSLFGQYVQQSWPSIWVLERMLFKYKPDVLMELGTGNGLLAAHFSMYAALNNAKFMTIDLDPDRCVSTDLMNKIPNTLVMKGDIYDEKTVERVTRFLNGGERPFLLVDGLDPKSKEVNLYAPGLKKGTVIFAHDCAISGSATGKTPKKWCFTEDQIDWKNVERLEPYYSLSKDLDTRMLCLVR